MTHEDYVAWINDEVAHNRMTPAQRDDLFEQKALFDAEFQSNLAKWKQKREVIGYVAGERTTGDTIHCVLKKAKERHPGRMVYLGFSD